MADPFDALRLPVPDIDPDPAFTRRLRARVERALVLPEGVTVSDLNIHDDVIVDTLSAVAADLVEAAAGPARTPALVPYLIVAGAPQALDWYVDVLGARRRGEVITMADGRIGHAELELRGSVLYLADESPESDVAAPRPGAGATVSLTFEVLDVDAVVARAVAEGADLERPASDNPYGRNAVIRDPFGHRWIISAVSPPPTAGVSQPTQTTQGTQTAPNVSAAVSDPVREGDIGYVSLWVPDVERAAAFFSRVLGWSYGPQAAGHARQVEDRELSHGLFGGQARSTLFLCFAVDDVDEAVARVGAAGGRAEEPTPEPFGRTAMCVDVEGTAFSLYQPPSESPGRRLAANGGRQGDLAYVTMEVQDSAAVRAFYGAVLGWRFQPGRVEDGWGPQDVMPKTGLHGGHEVTTVLPMYRVDDIYAATARVRGAGGTAEVPERHPYGLTSICVDDQGTRFYLGQL